MYIAILHGSINSWLNISIKCTIDKMTRKETPAVCLGICVTAKYKTAQIWSTENIIKYGNSVFKCGCVCYRNFKVCNSALISHGQKISNV
jgi:hypothetical protein